MEAGGDKAKKAHKKRQAGLKAKKKKEKKTGKVEKHNPRAFTFSGGKLSVQKRVQYTAEKQSKKEHAAKIDKNPDVPPPFVVVVQGPPGVGKTTLVESLVKHYAKQRLLHLGGPVTLVSGRQRRVTLVECPQEMSAMLDLAKVADLVLLLVDASYGFELETFEFINILQVHGFPRVIGVLTHLDSFKENKQLRRVKKTMKQRFWSEVYDGAKLFHFSGLQFGRYHRQEVQNLARFIAVAKYPLLSWRQSHPYLLALRWEDQTDPAAPREAPRRLDLYGYVCGGRLREGSQAHLAGVGDFTITTIKTMPDPCPPPVEVEAERNKARGVKGKKNPLRTLAERHRLVYAPGSDIGSITVDSDAMYIHLPEVKVGFTEREGEADGGELPEAVRLVRAMQGSEGALDRAAAARPGLRLLGGSTVRLPEETGEEGVVETKKPAAHMRRRAPEGDSSMPVQRTLQNEDDKDSEEAEEGEEEDPEQGESVGGDGEDSDAEMHQQTVLETARRRFAKVAKLEDLVYGTGVTDKTGSGATQDSVVPGNRTPQPTDHAMVPLFEEEEEDDEEAAPPQPAPSGLLGNDGDLDGVDTTRISHFPGLRNIMDEEAREALKTRKFITGGWSSAEEDDGDEPSSTKAAEGNEATLQGDGTATTAATPNANGEAASKGGGIAGAVAASKVGSGGSVTRVNTEGLEGFDDSVPIATFVRVRLEDVPAACMAELRRERPILLGGLLPGEVRMGLVQARVKRHRWHPKLLKSSDALLLSVGWRRFQTVPTFSLEDRGEVRMRFLKYTLEHAHCTMTTYGPMMPPNTGILAFRSWDRVGHFRICATGGVLESAPNFKIVKKLKLVGEPYKIFRNTAFIKNMFNSDLEVNKYMHSKLQTVSGIRGEVKKAEGTKGTFRATFEDRILMSDLIVCKCWIDVHPRQFYHPVIDVPQWRRARLIGELRAEAGVPVPDNKDSHYGKKVVRAERKFNNLHIPKNLQNSLPFAAKTHWQNGKRREGASNNPIRQKAAVVSTERELAINALLRRLHTVKKMKERVRTDTNEKKKVVNEKREKFIQDKRDARTKEERKKRYVKDGQQEQRKRKRLRLE